MIEAMSRLNNRWREKLLSGKGCTSGRVMRSANVVGSENGVRVTRCI